MSELAGVPGVAVLGQSVHGQDCVVGVGALVGVLVGVGVVVEVATGVTGVLVGVDVAVSVPVGVGVLVGVEVDVGIGVLVGVDVDVGVPEPVATVTTMPELGVSRLPLSSTARLRSVTTPVLFGVQL